MNPHNIILVEPQTPYTFYPFSILHPVFELRCGALRLFEKVQRAFPSALLFADGREAHIASFRVRFPNVLADETALMPPSNILILKANLVLSQTLASKMAKEVERICAQRGFSQPIVFTGNGKPCAAYCTTESLKKQPNIEELCALGELQSNKFYAQAITVEIPEALTISYLWDAIKHSANGIREDATYFPMNGNEKLRDVQGMYALAPENISIGENVDIAPLVVIDARKGPVIIGANAEIQPHVSIIGPCSIGENSLVKAQTRLYEGTSLGEWSKVAGELKNTIFQSYGNKQHEGCLGYSFIGEWVNLGAGTDVSDLKNNYGNIRVRFSPDKVDEINTGTTSLGLLAGCHTKSAINTSFNTGTVTGIGANVFEAKPDKYVPSYSWGGLLDSPFFEEEKAIELARTVMSRRNRILSQEEEHLLREEYRR